jgi:hypothetical protein
LYAYILTDYELKFLSSNAPPRLAIFPKAKTKGDHIIDDDAEKCQDREGLRIKVFSDGHSEWRKGLDPAYPQL